MVTTTIALIDSTIAAIEPARDAILDALPAARVWNILDDRLQEDADERGGVDPTMQARMRRLIAHAIEGGADAILLTCSIYADVAHQQAPLTPVPLLAADDGALDEVLIGHFDRVLVVASLPSPLEDVSNQLRRRAGRQTLPHIDGVVPDGAYEAARSGNAALLAERISAAVHAQAEQPDAILLAQFSLAPARAALEGAIGIPVIAGPNSAAAAVSAALNSTSKTAPTANG